MRRRRLVVVGRLDFRAAHQLARRIDGLAPSQGLALDLSRVTYIDLSALTVLLTADGELRKHSKALVILQPSACVCQALRLFGMSPCGPMPVEVRQTRKS